MQEIIKQKIKEVLKNLEIEEVNFIKVDFSIEHPEDFKNGDYSTNVALVIFRNIRSGLKSLSKDLSKDENSHYTKDNFEKVFNSMVGDGDKSNIYNYNKPSDIAILIKKELEKNLPKEIEKIEEKNGFINFYLSRDFFESSVGEILKQKENWGKNDILSGDKIIVEYTQPNPFKPFHIGHLMSNAIGESVSRIVEFSGAKTIRANYQGDVGPHVAKAIYGLIKLGMPDENKSVSEKAQYIGECYIKGNEMYETDENIKKEIDEINKKIYVRNDKKINEIYDWGRSITLEAFEEIYKILGTKFDEYYFESEMAEVGKKIVKKHIGDVFEESNGAIVFHGEEHDPKLHTRVFINSQGLPTYEAKELGLNFKKFEKSIFKKQIDLSIITTAVEQAEYMKVIKSAISLIRPELEDKMVHITHGMMRLANGKMSSRKGNIISGESLLRDSMQVVLEKVQDRDIPLTLKKRISEIVGVGALKYSILKSAIGGDIIFDFEKSISFEGDSGPYLQYTAVRANSILEKAKGKQFKITNYELRNEMPEITDLEKLLYQFPETVERSYKEFAPHYIATYLTELASSFNSFYANNKIIDSENKFMQYQLSLVKAFYQTMKNGLYLLGIEVPEKM